MSTTVSSKDRLLDIAMNLARIGNWTADAYAQKTALINRFMKQTNDYIHEVSSSQLSKEITPLFQRFKNEFEALQKEKITLQTKDIWAERALTWANILQHRAKLA